jgi:hypothetical protein
MDIPEQDLTTSAGMGLGSPNGSSQRDTAIRTPGDLWSGGTVCTSGAGIGGNEVEILIGPETASEAKRSARDQGSVTTGSSPVPGLGDVASPDVGTPGISSEHLFVQGSQGVEVTAGWLPLSPSPHCAREEERGRGTKTGQKRRAAPGAADTTGRLAGRRATVKRGRWSRASVPEDSRETAKTGQIPPAEDRLGHKA